VTITVTYALVKTVWPTRIPMKPRGIPTRTKKMSRASASTSSGMTIRAYVVPLRKPCVKRLPRASARAPAVPRTAEATATSAAMRRLFLAASIAWSLPQASEYQCVVKPRQSVRNGLSFTELSTTTTTGANRNTYTSRAYT
jgi:hypothetical protein